MTVFKALAGASLLAMAGAASAECGGTYCGSHAMHGSHSMQHGMSAYDGAASYGSGTYDAGDMIVSSSYNTYSSYSSAPSYVASDAYADATYGSGYISDAYEDTSYVPFSTDVSHSGTISGLSLPGLGANEQLCPTSCGSAVGGGKVLGCYAVCKPAPVPVTTTSYTQVVHPVIYVRYPVPYAVPYALPSYGVNSLHYSRYGDHAHRKGYKPNCSYDYGYHGHAAGYGGGYGWGCR